jgi:peroxiredoxin Q/BCP
LRDSAEAFEERNCAILGASFDSPEENRSFRDAQGFPFPLLADVDHSVGSAYGVVRTGGPYADSPHRYSFLIDPEGVVRRAYDVDDVGRHAAHVLADLDTLRV